MGQIQAQRTATAIRLFAALVLLLCARLLAAQEVAPPVCPLLHMADAQQRLQVMDFVCYLRAHPGQQAHAAAQPQALPTNADWQPAGVQRLVFEQSDAVYWLRLHLHNDTPSRSLWYLHQDYPLLDEVTFWLSNDAQPPMVTGDTYPFHSRRVNYRHLLLPIELDAGEVVTVHIRVRSRGTLNLSMALKTPDELIASSNHATLSEGIFYGALLIFAAFNVLLFLGSRIIAYLYNAFYLLALGMFLFALVGFSSQYLWPNSPVLANVFIPISMGVCVLSMALFTRSFLEVRRHTAINGILVALMVMSAGMLLWVFVLPYEVSVTVNLILGMVAMAVMAVIGMVRWAQGYTLAKWYVLASGCLFFGALTYTLAAYRLFEHWLPPEVFMRSTVGQIAIGAQMLLLNYALVQRWQMITQRALDAEHTLRTSLEKEVSQRTQELQVAMQELEQANERLTSLSLKDPLTGLGNRRFMDQMLTELSADAQRTRRQLSLAILDADHFKALNDRWGHEFGDQCLKAIAAQVRANLFRPLDAAARYGGEEIALILPDTDAKGALQICTRILEALRSSALTAPDGQAVTVTLSAGVAELAPGEDGTELFRRADEALYRAKHNGRDQVAVF